MAGMPIGRAESEVQPVEWVRTGEVFAPEGTRDATNVRMLRPWVLEEPMGHLRIWYSEHDGMTGRIVAATQRPGEAWERLGVAIDAGFAGDSDGYSVESPCVVHTPGGYLMAYGGFDGEMTRLHMATSGDGRTWTAQGTIMQRGPQDALGASHPCLLTTEAGWWLYFSGYDGTGDSRRAEILAAVSPSGASWDRVGSVLAPLEGERAISHPCVIMIARTFYMFYASDDGQRVSIAMATSADGLSWDRHGTILAATGEGPEGHDVHTPCALRRHDGSLHLWYAGLPAGDTKLGYRICSARFSGPLSVGA
jgi:predicted GH43/DUF377 family glycosyl hydrolase